MVSLKVNAREHAYMLFGRQPFVFKFRKKKKQTAHFSFNDMGSNTLTPTSKMNLMSTAKEYWKSKTYNYIKKFNVAL